MPAYETQCLTEHCPRSLWTTTGGVEAIVRTLASHTQYIPDHLPRQADIARSRHGLIKRAISST